MKLGELLAGAGSIQELLRNTDVQSLTADSREAAPGVVFFALEGVSRDGHSFLPQVLASGAAAAVVRSGHGLPAGIYPEDARLVWVDDPRTALGEAASRFFGEPSKHLTVCGVTGTNGKTTTTYLLEALLERWGKAPAVIGTVENRFRDYRVSATHTTPDAIQLQRMLAEFRTRGARSLAIEVSSHALDQSRTWGMSFETVIFTNLTQDHLDYHRGLEEYFSAKARLFLEYPARFRVVHTDDPYGQRLAAMCAKKGFEVITFGVEGHHVNTRGLRFSASGIEGTIQIDWKGRKQNLAIHSPLIGGFNVQNLAGVIAAAVAMEVPSEIITAALSGAPPVPGRMEPVPNKRGLTAVVDYAHTPDALQNALKTLRAVCKGRLVCVFGCGGDRDPGKRPIMGAIAERLADEIFITSDNPRTENPESIIDAIIAGLSPAGRKNPRIHRICERAEAIKAAVRLLSAGDVLLIAGKGHEDYQIIGTTKHDFDDRLVARECLERE